jgi:hypothetical protein
MWAKEAVAVVLFDLSLPGACIRAMSFDLVKSYGSVSDGIINVMPFTGRRRSLAVPTWFLR